MSEKFYHDFYLKAIRKALKWVVKTLPEVEQDGRVAKALNSFPGDEFFIKSLEIHADYGYIATISWITEDSMSEGFWAVTDIKPAES